jgi:membrane dipeptidase
MQIFDLHNDALLDLTPERLREYLKKQGKDVKILLSIWTTKLKDPIKTIKDRSPLLNGHLLHIEDAHFLTPENITDFISLKPATVGLTWNNENALAGGAMSGAGITKWGYEVIRKLENAGIQIDTAHLNRKSFWQFAAMTARPILCTHTCFNAVCPHPRNLTDEQIKEIIKSNGLIGLTFVRQFLSADTTYCSSYDITNHILHYLSIDPLCGHLAIGTDYFGAEAVPDIESYGDFSNLTNALRQRGITDEIIQKILYTNARDFILR